MYNASNVGINAYININTNINKTMEIEILFVILCHALRVLS